MIEFRRLEMENFGPYYGRHSIEFSRGDGVWVAYGANGRGKTSILNAFRYALYGELKGRTGSLAPDSLVNKVALRAGMADGFRVALQFVLDGGEDWEIVRTFKKGRTPEQILRVSIDSAVQSQEAGQEALAAVAPPELSGFFLFDGEDLRRYELLLDHDAETVEDLRSAIERILGIPFLERAASAVSAVKDDADKQIADHLKRDAKTRQQGEALEQELKLKEHLMGELLGTQESLKKKQDTIADLEEQLKQHHTSTRVMERLEEARENLGRTRAKAEEAKIELEELTPSLWRLVLRGRMQKKLALLQQRQSALREKDITAAFGRKLIAELEKRQDICPLCESPLAPSRATALKHGLEQEGLKSSERQEAREIEGAIELISGILEGVSSELVLEKANQWDRERLEVHQGVTRVESLEEELRSLGTEEREIKELNRQRDQLIVQEGNLRTRIDEIAAKIAEHDRAIEKLRSKSEGSGSTLDPRVKALARLSEDLKKLFLETASVYREQMRASVEQQASEIFLQVRTDPGYEGLEINSGYGLTIIDAEGEPVPNRSAGYEHLVALSLLGALQSYSPNRGPIVVDSPFGRLDSDNTKKVIAALPRIANQTLLLVYEDEFDRDSAATALGDKLVREWDLVRQSSHLETAIHAK
jgi:DNA sulfur modification protein DndD